MQLEWFGQSTFRLADGDTTVFIDPFDDMSRAARAGCSWTTRRSRACPPTCCSSPTSTGTTTGRRHRRRSRGDPLDRGDARLAGRRGRRDRVRARRRRGNRSAGRTACSRSRSTECASRTSATSARRPCATSSPRRSAKIDLLFVPVGGGPTIGARQAMEIVEAVEPALSCRRTTGRSASTSSSRPTSSPRTSRRCSGRTRRSSSSMPPAAAYGPLLVVPAVP